MGSATRLVLLHLFHLLFFNSAATAMPAFDCSASKCPLTKEPLPESALETAVVFQVAVPSEKVKTGGHVCTMAALVEYIDESKGVVKFPASEKSHVISVCDLTAARKLCEEGDEACQVVAFRYGPQVYWLTVIDETLAQDRIAQVLGIEDVQVLHHGKIVCPDSSKSDDEVSSTLLAISKSEEGKKPTLVITGKRTGRWGAQGGHLHR